MLQGLAHIICAEKFYFQRTRVTVWKLYRKWMFLSNLTLLLIYHFSLIPLQWCFTQLTRILREVTSIQTWTSFRSWTTPQPKACLQIIPESYSYTLQLRPKLFLAMPLSTSAALKTVKLVNFSVNCFRFHWVKSLATVSKHEASDEDEQKNVFSYLPPAIN